MQYRVLGKTGIKVSRLCFGSLTLGPLQKNLTPQEAADLLLSALQNGLNFIDTAEIYQNYHLISPVLKRWPGDVVVSTKTYAYSKEQARSSLEQARRELDRDFIDIFLLHEQESLHTLRGHCEALDYLQEAKSRGLIGAVGFSCHTVAAAWAALEVEGIDVLHPLLNIRGIGIKDGSAKEMSEAVIAAHRAGIGIYAMKPLGGGHLIGIAKKAFRYLLVHEAVDAVAVGMGTQDELAVNLAWFSGRKAPVTANLRINRQPRKLLHLPEECRGCRQCLESCPQGALCWGQDGPLEDPARCIYCGYCGAACPEFCFRIV